MIVAGKGSAVSSKSLARRARRSRQRNGTNRAVWSIDRATADIRPPTTALSRGHSRAMRASNPRRIRKGHRQTRRCDGSAFSEEYTEISGDQPKQHMRNSASWNGCCRRFLDLKDTALTAYCIRVVIRTGRTICRFTREYSNRQVRIRVERGQLPNKMFFPRKHARGQRHTSFISVTARDLGNGRHVMIKLAERHLGWRAYWSRSIGDYCLSYRICQSMPTLCMRDPYVDRYMRYPNASARAFCADCIDWCRRTSIAPEPCDFQKSARDLWTRLAQRLRRERP